jgi:hypothetical protein
MHAYLLRIKDELLPKSEAGQAVAYILKNWAALTRYVEDGDLAIDINRTERSPQLDLPGQRPRRQDDGGLEELCCVLRTVKSGSVRVVPGRAHAHPQSLDSATRRSAAASLGRGPDLTLLSWLLPRRPLLTGVHVRHMEFVVLTVPPAFTCSGKSTAGPSAPPKSVTSSPARLRLPRSSLHSRYRLR